MTPSFARLCQIAATSLRLAVLLTFLAVPVLSIPSFAGNGGTIIDGTFKHSSGAGLVIVAGLKRAR
ncbi:hypothetical protein [Mesorhizobium xinjiangense]|uniref:hypothetical protein n=1 Tax=Mesorhizobium xinjiangense TaxID=2678685 RepID=UPI0012EE69C3|nr:hypothetical protein [Mesorhizobium xinjiangense]